MTKLEATFSQFEKAVNRLQEVLALEKNDVIRDSAIKRFELAIDLAWKLVKTFLEENKGIVCTSPKDCFREAYSQGIIEYEQDYLKFVDMRNETAHIYNEKIADRIYNELPAVAGQFEKLINFVKRQIK